MTTLRQPLSPVPPAMPALAALLGAALLGAAPAGPARAAAQGTLTAEYTGYSHGLTVMKLAGSLSFSATGYAIRITFRTVGMVNLVVHSDNDSTASGQFRDGTVQPARFDGAGNLRGTERSTHIAYVEGNPVIRALSPPVEQERSPVPPAMTRHTIDTLSALALLIRQVGQTGKCDGSVTTFDGRRLATQTSATGGMEVLPETDRSMFAGRALRCNLQGQQLGGFVRNEDEDDLRKPRDGTAWFADLVPGAPPVPVRVVFDNKVLGKVTLYLTAAGGGPKTVAQCCAAAPLP